MSGQTRNTRSGVAALCEHIRGGGITVTDRPDLRLQSFIRARCIPRDAGISSTGYRSSALITFRAMKFSALPR